jgi:hypothetical protein
MAKLWYDPDQPGVEVKLRQLMEVSNPKKVIEKAQYYFNDPNVKVYLSPLKNKKYAIYDPIQKKLISFGHIDYEDYSKHQDDKRRQNYLLRASNIKGDWKHNPYSSNNLSLHILW